MDKIVEFLRSDTVLNILALLPQRNALRVEEISLFERFAALCDGLPHLDGNECAGAFLGSLGETLECYVKPENLCTRDQQKSAWRALAEHNRAPQLTREDFSFADVQKCSIDCEDIASHIKNAQTDDLEQVSCELSKKSEFCRMNLTLLSVLLVSALVESFVCNIHSIFGVYCYLVMAGFCGMSRAKVCPGNVVTPLGLVMSKWDDLKRARGAKES